MEFIQDFKDFIRSFDQMWKYAIIRSTEIKYNRNWDFFGARIGLFPFPPSAEFKKGSARELMESEVLKIHEYHSSAEPIYSFLEKTNGNHAAPIPSLGIPAIKSGGGSFGWSNRRDSQRNWGWDYPALQTSISIMPPEHRRDWMFQRRAEAALRISDPPFASVDDALTLLMGQSYKLDYGSSISLAAFCPVGIVHARTTGKKATIRVRAWRGFTDSDIHVSVIGRGDSTTPIRTKCRLIQTLKGSSRNVVDHVYEGAVAATGEATYYVVLRTFATLEEGPLLFEG